MIKTPRIQPPREILELVENVADVQSDVLVYFAEVHPLLPIGLERLSYDPCLRFISLMPASLMSPIGLATCTTDRASDSNLGPARHVSLACA